MKIPIGTPIIIAPAVTYMLAIIISKIPYDAGTFVGAHFCPPTKSKKPISAIAGTPLQNKNIQIMTTAAILVTAVRKKTPCIAFSRNLFNLI